MKLCQLCHGGAEPSQNPCQARLASPRERLKDCQWVWDEVDVKKLEVH